MGERLGPGDPTQQTHESTERDAEPAFRHVILTRPVANGGIFMTDGYELTTGTTDLQQLPAGVELTEGEAPTWYVRTEDEIIVIHKDGGAQRLDLSEYRQPGASTALRPIGQLRGGQATIGETFTGRFTEPNATGPATYDVQLSGEVQEVTVELPRYGTRIGVPESASHTVAIMNNPAAYRRAHFRPGKPFPPK